MFSLTMHAQQQHVVWRMAEKTEPRISTAEVQKAVGAIQYLSSLNLPASTAQWSKNGSGRESTEKPGTVLWMFCCKIAIKNAFRV